MNWLGLAKTAARTARSWLGQAGWLGLLRVLLGLQGTASETGSSGSASHAALPADGPSTGAAYQQSRSWRCGQHLDRLLQQLCSWSRDQWLGPVLGMPIPRPHSCRVPNLVGEGGGIRRGAEDQKGIQTNRRHRGCRSREEGIGTTRNGKPRERGWNG